MVQILNTNITNFHGLDSLKSIYYHLIIGDISAGNDSLTSLTGLENLETVGTRLNIYDNDNLVNLEGLSSVRTVGILDVGFNDALTSFEGLNQLDTITKFMDISSNGSLYDISSLITVKYIQEHMSIHGNTILSSLYGVDNMLPVYPQFFHLTIEDNPLLSECDVNSVCTMLQMQGVYSLIENNAPGCATDEEVEDACGVGIKDIYGNELKIYPNPAGNYIIISQQKNYVNSYLTIYNLSGSPVMNKLIVNSSELFDVSGLPGGLYFVQVISGKETITGKFIKNQMP